MTASSDFVLAIHGGSGAILPACTTDPAARGLRAGLEASLKAGHRILHAGGSAVDAVVAAVVALENDPLFNAGHGATLTDAGTIEMDAAIMDGRDHSAGAIAGIAGPRNPVLAAKAVMRHSPHVLLTGEGAIAFCRRLGVPFAEPRYFYTEHRWQELTHELDRRRGGQAKPPSGAHHGTVGAVARDCRGNLAAATSTGGTIAKLPGRVGDSAIVGAGTWADNETCAVSATGIGEFFMRWAAAHEIAARMKHRGDSLVVAAADVVMELGQFGGEGGVIAVDRAGAVALPFNGAGMYCGRIGVEGTATTAICAAELPLLAAWGAT